MPIRVALYARYSTDLQSAASIDDQFRVCRDYAQRQGWTVTETYSDRAISGSTMDRPGLQNLLSDVTNRRFDVVLAEGMDRLSRDLGDVDRIYKRLKFLRIKAVTIADGDLGPMHIGMKGTMNAIFLTDLAQRTRRGLRGRIEGGKSGGGISYGYDVVRSLNADGMPITGEREINPTQAAVIQRIFKDYALGKSPRAIAIALNAEGIPGPKQAGWGQSTINGNPKRGTGILNNELYIGRLVWNRLTYVSDPTSNKRVSRPNEAEDIIVRELPGARIIDQALWQSVKDRQAASGHGEASPRQKATTKADAPGFWSHQRPRYLLTGLMKCGACGGGYSKISKNLFGCAAARNKGTCDNRLNIRTDEVEDIVLAGLKHRLMAPEIYKEFVAAFIAERNAIVAQHNAKFIDAKAEISEIKTKLAAFMNAILKEGASRSISAMISTLEAREDELNAILAKQEAPEPSLMPNLADIYHAKVAALHEALVDPANKDEAFGIIRTLIDEVRLIPESGQLRVDLRGALAGILSLAYNDKPHLRRGADGSVSVLVEQMKLVAGARFERAAFRL